MKTTNNSYLVWIAKFDTTSWDPCEMSLVFLTRFWLFGSSINISTILDDWHMHDDVKQTKTSTVCNRIFGNGNNLNWCWPNSILSLDLNVKEAIFSASLFPLFVDLALNQYIWIPYHLIFDDILQINNDKDFFFRSPDVFIFRYYCNRGILS